MTAQPKVPDRSRGNGMFQRVTIDAMEATMPSEGSPGPPLRPAFSFPVNRKRTRRKPFAGVRISD